MITTDTVLQRNPCVAYPEERITEILGTGKTREEIAAGLPGLPAEDALWLLMHKDQLTPAEARRLAIRVALLVVTGTAARDVLINAAQSADGDWHAARVALLAYKPATLDAAVWEQGNTAFATQWLRGRKKAAFVRVAALCALADDPYTALIACVRVAAYTGYDAILAQFDAFFKAQG